MFSTQIFVNNLSLGGVSGSTKSLLPYNSNTLANFWGGGGVLFRAPHPLHLMSVIGTYTLLLRF